MTGCSIRSLLLASGALRSLSRLVLAWLIDTSPVQACIAVDAWQTVGELQRATRDSSPLVVFSLIRVPYRSLVSSAPLSYLSCLRASPVNEAGVELRQPYSDPSGTAQLSSSNERYSRASGLFHVGEEFLEEVYRDHQCEVSLMDIQTLLSLRSRHRPLSSSPHFFAKS